MKIPKRERSFLTMTIMALQVLGIVPYTAKKKKTSENEQKMEVSQLMWIWCIVVRVLYVVAFSVIAYDQLQEAIRLNNSINLVLGSYTPYFLLPYNVLFAPLQWKSNLILHNHLLRLKHRTQALKSKKKSLTKSRAVFVFFSVLQFLLNSSVAYLGNESFFFNVMYLYLTIYFLVMVVLQVILFQCCCSTIEDFVPDTSISFIEMKSYTSSVKTVRDAT